MRRASDWTMRGDGSRQRPHGLKSTGSHGPLLPLNPFLIHYHILPASYGVPPVQQLHYPSVHLPIFPGPLHPNGAVLGYAVRPCRYYGRKVNRGSGKRKPRAISYARRLYVLNGEWPEWAPHEWALPGTIFPPP